MPRKYDRNAAAHRRLHLGDRGEDVKRLQKATNLRLKRKKLKQRVKVDGSWDKGSRSAYRRVCWLLGLDHRFTTKGNQKLVRLPSHRPERMKRLEKKRAAGGLQTRALRVARSLLGVMEHGGNNAGPMVSKIIRENGGYVGEPWCGDFVAYCYRHAGSKCVQRGWASTLQLGFLAGMGRTSKPIAGDIVVYDFPGGASSDHTGEFVRWISGGIDAIEGNTGRTGAVSDSATGGDGVYEKHRPSGQIARFVRVYR